MATNVPSRTLAGGDFSQRISEQTDAGVINTNPVFTQVRRTDGVQLKTISRTTSSEVKTNRQGRQNIDDTSDLAMTIPFELTQQTAGFLIAAIHSVEENLTEAPVTTLESSAVGFVDTNGVLFTNVSVGDWIWLDGFTNPLLNAFYQVSEKIGNGDIHTSTAPVAVEAAGASVTMTSRKYASGDKQTLYTGQRRVVDESEALDISYSTMYDGVLNEASLEIGESGIVTGSLSVVYQKEMTGTAPVTGQTDALADVSDIIGAGGDKYIIPFYVDGVNTAAAVKSLSVTINNNYQEDRQAGVVGAYQALSDPEYTGSMVARAMTSDPLFWERVYQQGTRKSISIPVKWPDGREMIIDIPQAIASEMTQSSAGNTISSAEVSIGMEESTVTGDTIRLFFNDWT